MSYGMNLNAVKKDRLGEGLAAIKGKELKGEMDDSLTSHVLIADVAKGLEKSADMMGKITRLDAIKMFLRLPVTKQAIKKDKVLDSGADAFLQVAAGGLPLMGEGLEDLRKESNGEWTARRQLEGPALQQELTEKQLHQARQEEAAITEESAEKMKFEQSQKVTHQILKKELDSKAGAMQSKMENFQKHSNENEAKSQKLGQVVRKASESSSKEHALERQQKKGMENKLTQERDLLVNGAKENAAKRTFEKASKALKALNTKDEQEIKPKSTQESSLKADHQAKIKFTQETASKSESVLKQKNDSEQMDKNDEEKALKTKSEQRSKREMEVVTKQQSEASEKFVEEGIVKKKREKALKEAAQRRIAEEQKNKSDKSDALKATQEAATKAMTEKTQKVSGEEKEKLDAENDLKKQTEKTEKQSREVNHKNSGERRKKRVDELKNKMADEDKEKKETLAKHKKSEVEAKQALQTIKKGEEEFRAKIKKTQEDQFENKAKLENIGPEEQKLKEETQKHSRVAKEIAKKISLGNADKCSLAERLEGLKRKGLLIGTHSDDQCKVTCVLKPGEESILSSCELTGDTDSTTCQRFLYVRAQSLASAVVTAVDLFNSCGVVNEEEMGESKNTDPKLEKNDAVSVGEYVDALKDMVAGEDSVNVGHAVDLLLKCNKDDDDGNIGESSKQYNPNVSDAFKSSGSECELDSLQNSLREIQPVHRETCAVSCSVQVLTQEAYDSKCAGDGSNQCFIDASEYYHREMISAFYSWKAYCVKQD